jgi:hypothetical protein
VKNRFQSLPFKCNLQRYTKAFIPPNAALRYEVQVLRCVPSGESGSERLCCSDANFPCDPEGLVSGVASTPGGTTEAEE